MNIKVALCGFKGTPMMLILKVLSSIDVGFILTSKEQNDDDDNNNRRKKKGRVA